MFNFGKKNRIALVVVDMQRYYLDPKAPFFRYPESISKGSLDYIKSRCEESVIPNIGRLLDLFRKNNLPIIYLRLCGKRRDRGDLHRFFHSEYVKAKNKGFDELYPLRDDYFAGIIEEIQPIKGEKVIDKTTFSGFSSSGINCYLRRKGVGVLVFTGLATSQCVETTARDASDYGYSVLHIDDAQADYTQDSHFTSLYSSRSVCGYWIYNTENFIANFNKIYRMVLEEERG